MAKYMDLLRAHQTPHVEAQTTTPLLPPQQPHHDLLLPDEVEAEKPEPQHHEPMLLLDEDEAEYTHQIHPTHAKESEPPQDQADHSDSGLSTQENSAWLQACVQFTETIFDHAQQSKPFDIAPLSQHIQTLLVRLEQDDEQLIMDALELSISQQIHLIRDLHPDLGHLIQKSIMMMLYAIKAGQRLKLSAHDLLNHTLAAMLHHIGMAQVSTDIRSKKERLNKDELKEIHQATLRGHACLQASDIEEKAILQAALQANERYDGSGETGLSGSDIAWSARLTGVLSMFEALIHYRPYRNRLLPRDAIREMVKHHKKAFDPNMLKALIESISLYPIGTYAQLNSGDIGLVIHIHPYRPLRPVVEIRMDRYGNPIPPRKVDLTTQPNLNVERCMYEEATLELSSQSKTEHTNH